jgi:recombination protein RecT
MAAHPSDAARAAVAQRAAQATDPEQPRPEPTLGQLIENLKPEMARTLPRHMDADRMARMALTLVRQTPKLADCTRDSFLGALMTCAALGLEPGPLGHAWLVPYGRECTFIVGYKGLIELAWRSGRLQSITAETIRANDEFEFAAGLDPHLTHRWNLTADRGAPIGWYAAARLKDGGSAFVVMSRADVEAIRARSRARDKGPWVTDYEAMAKKTCIRQLARWLPLSVEFAQAIAQDEGVRTDLTDAGIDMIPTFVDGETVPAGVDPATGVITDLDEGPDDEAGGPTWPPVREPGAGTPGDESGDAP